jgi:hypothetical protein
MVRRPVEPSGIAARQPGGDDAQHSSTGAIAGLAALVISKEIVSGTVGMTVVIRGRARRASSGRARLAPLGLGADGDVCRAARHVGHAAHEHGPSAELAGAGASLRLGIEPLRPSV